MGNTKAAHHRGAHQRRAKHVTQWANNHPEYRCPTCGHTRTEGVTLWGAQGEWEAGHIIAGDSSGGYQPEHRHCNRSAGSMLGHARRATGYDWP